MFRPTLTVVVACVLLAAVGDGVAIGLRHGVARPATAVSGEPAATPVSRSASGWPFDRPVPQMALRNAQGRRTSLAALRGRVVVLAPTLTLCAEVCPMTTGAFEAMRHTVDADGLGSRVAFVEVTVDPWRDSPARLRAYARLTGVRLDQLTGSVAEVRRFWDFFQIGFRQVPQGHPADVDWWTHRPESFDVEHADGVFLVDPQGRERTFFPGPADMRGRLGPALRSLLSATGRANLSHPVGAWTTAQVLDAVGRLLGASIRAPA